VRKSGQRVKLAGQPFEVLRALLERPGEIVTREELRQRLWPQNTFVDHELAIKKAVNRLREVLSDSAESPHFIETIPGHGYRFIGNIAASSIQSEPNKSQEADADTSKPSQSLSRMTLLKRLSVPMVPLIVGGLLLLLNVDKMRTRIFARSQPLEIHSIAVLPLQDLSSDPKQEYFSRLPGKWGKKKEIQKMSYLYVSGIASGCGLPTDRSAIKACLKFAGHSQDGGLRRRRRRV
jgi:DNA-binding winged helix-turn-helix (wHTH) protein